MGFFSNLLRLKRQSQNDQVDVQPPEREMAVAAEIVKEEIREEKLEPVVSLNGQVAIVEGVLQIVSPQEGGSAARIQAGKGVHIWVNGQEIKKMTSVLAEDTVEIILDNEDAVREAEVKVSLDQMEVYLDLARKNGREITLDHCKARTSLIVEGKVREVVPQPWTKEELLSLLQEAGVVHGLDQEALEKIIANQQQQQHVLVAEGTPYTAGTDGFIEYCFLEESKLVPSVEEGDLVAIRHLAVPGKDGQTVTGKIITAPGVKECELQVGRGLTISEDGMQAIATESGRPVVKKDVLSIEPVYTFNGDVTTVKNNGHLAFKGHLIVSGSVQEGMRIETGGDLEVRGGVMESELLSGGTVNIQKSLIASHVCSGRFKLIYDSTVIKLEQMAKETKKLLEAALQLKSKVVTTANKQVSEDKIIKLLLSSRFPTFISLVKQVLTEVEPIRKYLAKDILDKFTQIAYYQDHYPEQINELPKLYQLVNEINGDLTNYFASSKGDIFAYYLQNCQIEASGNIYINGMGCYNSVLLSKGEVRIEGNPGIFRGGKIVAGDNVYIKELGCPSGAPTAVEIPESKKIVAGFVYPGVILKLGNKIYRNFNPVKNFDIYLDAEENLQVTSLKGE